MSGIEMPGALPYLRIRAGRKPDPYNPARTVEDWDAPDSAVVINGFLASSTSTELTDGAREEAVSTAVLTVADPAADVRRGDRIEFVPADGRTWQVTGFPASDANPFTGWRPTLEVQLQQVVG